MATVASKVLARIAALRKGQEHSSQSIIENNIYQSLLDQPFTHAYSTDEEQLVDQELMLAPTKLSDTLSELCLAPFNHIQANSLQISEIQAQYDAQFQNRAY